MVPPLLSSWFASDGRPGVEDAANPLHPAGSDMRPDVLGPAELRAVARRLVPAASELGELSGGDERGWQLLARTDGYEAWVIGWPPGGSIELHDHGGSRGVVQVVSGRLVETSVIRLGDRLALRSRPVSAATRPLGIGATRIHDVTNPGPAPVLSVHVYSPPLTSMTFYELDNGALRAGRRELVGERTESARRAS